MIACCVSGQVTGGGTFELGGWKSFQSSLGLPLRSKSFLKLEGNVIIYLYRYFAVRTCAVLTGLSIFVKVERTGGDVVGNVDVLSLFPGLYIESYKYKRYF